MTRFGHLPQRHLFSAHVQMLLPSPLFLSRPTTKLRFRSNRDPLVISRRFQSRIPSDPEPSIRNTLDPTPISSIESQTAVGQENIGSFRGPTTNDALVAGRTISNKDQRKADWTIMKEMSRYLWPKVMQVHCEYAQPSSDNLCCRMIWEQSPG